MMTVQLDRMGERRLDCSDWHRNLVPSELYTTDLDSVEYRRGRECVALIEAKFGDAQMKWSQASALKDLATRSQLPLFEVNYTYEKGSATPAMPRPLGRSGTLVDWDKWETWRFKVQPQSPLAAQKMGKTPPNKWITSQQYIEFLESL